MTSKQLVAGAAALGVTTLLYEAYRWKYMDCDWTTAGYIFPRSVKPSYFKNRIIWITGASSGIGRALCYYLVSLKVGIKLIITSRRQQTLEDLKGEIIEKNRNEIYGTDIYVLPMDLSKKTVKYYRLKYNSIKEYFNISSIDILINNAGIGMLSDFHKFKAKNSTDILQTNLVSPIILSKLVLTDIINNNKNSKQSPFGHICNIGSIIAYLLVPQQTTYNASKAALLAFGISLAQEMERYSDITITDVLPGAVATSIDINSKLSHGRTAGKKSKMIQNGMTTERCAELICIAISNKLRESWSVKGVGLYAVYIGHYNPWFFNRFIRPKVAQIMSEGTKRSKNNKKKVKKSKL